MSLSKSTTNVPIAKITGTQLAATIDTVVREIAVTLFLNDQELATLVCSPKHLTELAIGFLCAEGILQEHTDLKGVIVNETDGLIWVETTKPMPAQETFLKRYITTCCGRGRSSFYFINDARGSRPVTAALTVTAEDVLALSKCLEEAAILFKATGGAHVAALSRPGEVLLLYEDIGRHNAVDKIFGRCFLDGISFEDKLLVFSGRVSSEILIKVAKMGVPVLVSRGAPTDLALDMATELGITVVGFARGERMNVYTHGQRISLLKK